MSRSGNLKLIKYLCDYLLRFICHLDWEASKNLLPGSLSSALGTGELCMYMPTGAQDLR